MSLIKSSDISKILDELTRARFWGCIQIDYQNGEPTLIRKTETTKVASNFNGGDTRHEHHKQQ